MVERRYQRSNVEVSTQLFIRVTTEEGIFIVRLALVSSGQSREIPLRS